MAALNDFNKDTNYAEFAIDSAAEIELLPTTEHGGSGALERVSAVAEGSLAILPDLSMYRLRPTGWTAV